MHAPVGAISRAFEHHDERHPIGDGELRDPIALGVGGLADRSRLHREVLGRHHDRIEKVRDARAHIELAGRAVFREPFLAPHRARRAAAFAQIVERRLPAFASGVAHGPKMSDVLGMVKLPRRKGC